MVKGEYFMRDYVEIIINEKKYKIEYDFNSVIILQESGIDILALDGVVMKNFKILRSLITAGLMKHHDDINEQTVGSMLNTIELITMISTACMNALKIFMGDNTEDPEIKNLTNQSVEN